MKKENIEIFWSLVGKSEGCWLWNGKAGVRGYGAIYLERKQWLAHRLSWYLQNGDIPTGKLICHHCDVPLCVRPDHLFCGTDLDNNLDKERKNRGNHVRGEKHFSAKLTEGQIIEIRRLCSKGEDRNKLAVRLGVSRSAINHAFSGHSWKHLPGAILNPTSQKLTERDVLEIKKLRSEGYLQDQLGEKFGVAQSCISRILGGVRWRHVS